MLEGITVVIRDGHGWHVIAWWDLDAVLHSCDVEAMMNRDRFSLYCTDLVLGMDAYVFGGRWAYACWSSAIPMQVVRSHL